MFSIPDKYIIHDLRNSKEFNKLTISGYKIQDVSNAYQNSMINNNLEDSIRWCVELHCTGLENNIWNSLYILITKHIHINKYVVGMFYTIGKLEKVLHFTFGIKFLEFFFLLL